MRTTININDVILRDLRACAKDEGRPFREVVEETLLLGLAQQSKPKPAKRFRVRPHRLELKPGFRAASLNQLYDQLEAEDAARGT